MKDYAAFTSHSTSMSSDAIFLKALNKLFDDYPIDTIIESGTYKGTGSTKTIADIIVAKGAAPSNFYTIEVDYNFYTEAVKNLKKYPFITPLWGLSVDGSAAIEFIKNDDAINNHEQYPDVYIDRLINPADFYITEINGKLSQTSKEGNIFQKLFRKKKPAGLNFQNDIFSQLLPKVKDKFSLVLLDSAGGIGFFEFKTMLHYLQNSNFILILDDIHHLKHFRSLAYVEQAANFTLIQKSEYDGWAIALHTASGKS